MTYTGNCDVYGAFHEDAINKVVHHVMHQRPSMFNYATFWFVEHLVELCKNIDAHSEVGLKNNPMITVEPLLPIVGTNYGLDFCLQVTELELDFHPSTNINLPPELNPPLKEQHLALRAKVCVGVACPDKDILDQYTTTEARPGGNDINDPGPRTALPIGKINCFCLEGIADCHVKMTGGPGAEEVSIALDGFEIVDIKPEGLENALECYIATTLRLAVLSKFKLALDFLTLTIEQIPMGLSLKPTPISPDVEFNPSVADDQLAVFMDLEVAP